MKVDVIKAYAAIVFEGVFVTPNGMQVHDVFTFTSTKPITVEHKTLEEIGFNLEEKSVLTKTVKGLGATHALRLTSDAPIASADRVNNTMQVSRYAGSIVILSSHDEAMVYETLMPQANARELFGAEPLTVEQKSLTEVLDNALEFDKQRGAFLERFGISEPTDALYALAKEQTARLRDFAAKAEQPGANTAEHTLSMLGEAAKMLGQIKASDAADSIGSDEIVSMENMRFATSEATDFRNVSMQCGDHFHDSNLLRVVHTSPPEWREPTEEMKKAGYIGYWHFDRAALAMSGGKGAPEGMLFSSPKDVEVNMAYATKDDLNLAVKSHDAINPAGTCAVPEMLFKILSGRDPLATMSCEDGDQYNKDHLLPWPQAVASAIADHTLASVKGTKPPKRKSN